MPTDENPVLYLIHPDLTSELDRWLRSLGMRVDPAPPWMQEGEPLQLMTVNPGDELSRAMEWS